MKTRVALLGAGFISEIHLESYRRFVPNAEVVAVYSHSAERAKVFAEKHNVPAWYDDITRAINESACAIVDVCLPNFRHAPVVIEAARAGKHVIVEKPLAITLEEADEMIAVCKEHGRKLMYAEELCFAPKYERVRKLADEKAFGRIYMLKQAEKHSGPHSDWFYDVDRSGGGVLMDMGCHALAWFRWMLGNAKPVSVQAHLSTVLHGGRTRGEDNSVVIVEFEGGASALPKIAGRNSAAWKTMPKSTAQKEYATPIFFEEMRHLHTVRKATGTRWKKLGVPKVGRSRCSKKLLIRAIHRNLLTLWSAFAKTRHRL